MASSGSAPALTAGRIQAVASLLGFAPAVGCVNTTRRHLDYSFDDVMVRTHMLDEYDLELAFDSPTVRVNRLRLDELLPMTRMVAHFSALDRD